MDEKEFEALTTEDAFRKRVLQFIDFTEQRFAEINTRLNNQDSAIAQNTALTSTVATQTQSVRDFMSDGANAAKFFCRLAAGWRFIIKWVLASFCLPVAILYTFGYYKAHGTFPTWVIAIAKALGW